MTQHDTPPQSDTEQLAALLWREGTYSGLWFGDRLVEASKILAAQSDLQRKLDMAVSALEEARAALHQHYVDWDGEPEDAVPLQLARAACDATLLAIKDTPTNG